MDKVIVTRGNKRSEIESYFANVDPGPVMIDILKESTATLGSLNFPEVTLRFRGDEVSVMKVYNNFRLYFMRAGG